MSLIIYRFTADWCGPCKRFAPVFEAGMKEFPQVPTAIIDVGEGSGGDNELLAEKYGIKSIPAVVAVNNGMLVATLRGAVSQDTLENWITDVLNEINPDQLTGLD